jgi:hypothetical protein
MCWGSLPRKGREVHNARVFVARWSLVHAYLGHMYSWCAYFIFPEALLVGNKIYMPATSHDDIIVVDLMTSSFSTIQLLQGVKYRYFHRIVSGDYDASSIYLIHVEEFRGTICLHEMLATLDMSDHTLEDDDTAKVQIIQMGDHHTMVSFIFFKIGPICILYSNIK